MIRIVIEDGVTTLVDAVVDVPRRRVVALKLDDVEPMEAAFVALAVVSGELEACEVLGARKSTLKREQRTVLTLEQMATAMGLVGCRLEWNDECLICGESTLDWMWGSGQVLEGYCHVCLPVAFERHMKEQAEEDKLVEADGTEEEKRRRGEEERVRPEPPTCEGGCE